MMDLELEPVDPEMGKAEGDIAVGEDLHFQERWWRFERAAWGLFALVIVAALLGAFGQGWLARTSRSTGDGLRVDYERIERVGAPSMLTIRLRGEGEQRIHVSDALVHELGGARVVPTPAQSIVGDGVTYVYPVHGDARVDLALTPRSPGVYAFDIAREGGGAVRGRIVVLP